MYNRQKQKLSEDHGSARRWPSAVLLAATAIVYLASAGSLCSASDLETITPPPKGMKWGMTFKEAKAIIPVKFIKEDTDSYVHSWYRSSTNTETRRTLNRLISTGVDGLEICRISLSISVDGNEVAAARFELLEYKNGAGAIFVEDVLMKKYGEGYVMEGSVMGHEWMAKDGSILNVVSSGYKDDITSVLDPTRKSDSLVLLLYLGPIWDELHEQRFRDAAEKEKAKESDF